MIISITEYCKMECSHCCMNAGKDGKHMSKETFIKALDFYQKFDFPYIFISGGEPTDHPQFEEFMDKIIKRKMELVVLSNGLFIMDERKDRYLSKCKFQIINDERYYPIKVPHIEHPNILVFGKVENPISKCTRSIANKIYNYNKPKCFNLRSISKHKDMKNFKDVIHFYTYRLFKLCAPIIKIDGSMILGECDLCKPFAHINDSLETLFEKIKAFKCNNCKCFENLEPSYRKHLGE